MNGEYRFDTAAELATQLCNRVVDRLSAALAARGAASMIVSGGKTPQALFERLARVPLDWPRIAIRLADERWVDTDDPSSNTAFVREHLLKSMAAGAKFVPMKNAAATPALGAADAWLTYAQLQRPFDLVLLGMGDDGHTASLFPGNANLPEALDPRAPPGCVAMQAPVAPHARLSLNLAALLDAREIIVSSTGPSKWRVYNAARLAGDDVEYPVRAVLRQPGTPVDFFWAP